ncbi:protein kinase [Bacillus sp. JCM 19046]|nr:protein kinase [Bacillus sp. JCM 19046]
MMKLSNMEKWMDTVDSNWKSPAVEDIAALWGYDQDSVYFLRASANFIATFLRKKKRYYLRFNDASERSLSMVEAELKLIQAPALSQLPIAQPIPSNNGKLIENITNDLGTFYAVVFEAATGKHKEVDALTKEEILLWGAALGSLHAQLKQLPHSCYHGRPSWNDQLNLVEESLPNNETHIRRELTHVRHWGEQLEVSQETYGMIHYDFELDNVLFQNQSLGMIDFDDASVNWYVADLVYALRDLGPFNEQHSVTKTFIRGYQSKTSLDLTLLKEAPMFERLHTLCSYAKLERALDVDIVETSPAWLVQLQQKLLAVKERYRQAIIKAAGDLQL